MMAKWSLPPCIYWSRLNHCPIPSAKSPSRKLDEILTGAYVLVSTDLWWRCILRTAVLDDVQTVAGTSSLSIASFCTHWLFVMSAMKWFDTCENCALSGHSFQLHTWQNCWCSKKCSWSQIQQSRDTWHHPNPYTRSVHFIVHKTKRKYSFLIIP